MNYFVSDMHFGHNNIIEFERKQFNSIQEHDNFLVNKMKEWANKLKPGDVWYNLGDWGDTDFLWTVDFFNAAGIKTVFIYGNHDKKSDKNKFQQYFEEVYEYPVFLSNKLVISHYPVAVYDDTVNVHGHTHGMIIDKPNYITCSINDIDYKMISDKNINSVFSKLPKYNRRFLWEPFANDLKITKRDTNDIVCDKDGKIDIGATRAFQKFIASERIKK